MKGAFATVAAPTFAALTVIVTLSSARADGFDACAAMFPGGAVPQAQSPTVQDLCKTIDVEAIFAVRFDTTRKIPNWTAHRLSASLVEQGDANDGKLKRPSFKRDKAIRASLQAIDDSYTNSGYQRGHMVPADDMSWSKAAYDATFVLSNAVPQVGGFNNKSWRGLEEKARDWGRTKKKPIWIFAGTYGGHGRIGERPHTPEIPKCFYKIVVAPGDGDQSYKVLAALFAGDNDDKRNQWALSLTTLDTVRARSGIDFLAGLNVENGHDADYWGVAMPATPADCIS